ncbi:hypothetical protein BJ508DRAFT_59264 [Ascobolus immersus RN42]|uniref:Transcription factor domain-containing protein n=1 Tax=Ascobolus immersus RN42 TaxID=1160509 RepID=A0A3N4IT78_ASCIM|nr:hypothetical protein BJ508DRAFT_59264 [Ascobolus immersus RN42]
MQTLSPILSSPPELAEHPELLNSEPFLMTTIITIASRYKPLVGQGGASRSMYIHEMLWKELKRGFERLLWGGAPAPVSPDRGAATDRGAKGLRTMGTVEALIVLTEWHVRSAHFPMELGGDTWGILRHANDDDSGRRASMFGSRNGEKIGDMLEPVRRSDTMSWMLLGNALSLSYELGVFDEDTRSQEEDAPYRYQCKRLQRKLLVYIMQLASRLGFTPMVPMEICNLESFSHLKNGTPTWSTVGEMNDVVYDYWAELSLLMKKGASLLFPSRSATKEIIRQGKYNSLLRSCLPEMRDWKDRFERLGLPSPIHNILTLEYEHVRIFHNSLALQAVVERCTSSATAGNPKQPPSHSFAALMQMYSGDVEFINELVDAARCMLTTVVEKMMPGDELRHAPVRIYLRILSAAMFLLKTFALGAKEDDITVSLELMHNTTEALRAAAVDDVHLAWRFADLLETLTKRIQRRFVRMHRNGVETPLHGNGTHTPQPGTPMQHNQLHQQQHRMDLSKLLDGPVTSSMAPGGLHSIASPNGMHQQQYPMHYSQPGTPGSQGHHGPMDFFYSPNEPAFDDWLAIPIDPILDGGYGAGNGKEGMVYQNGLGIGVGLGVEVDGRGVDLLDVLLGMGEG